MPLGEPHGNELIHQYLMAHPQITVLSDVGYSTLKADKHHTNEQYLSGERFVYVQSDLSPSLPGNTQIGDYNARIYQKSQAVYCLRCNTKNMHKTADTHACESFRADSDDTFHIHSISQ